jgi:protein-tyrosine phosphatase
MDRMIDIHSHILPGIDDGAANLEEALALAKAAAKEGITDIIATPHYANGAFMNRAQDIRRHVQEFNEELKRSGIPLTVHAGQEIRVHHGMLDAWHGGELLTLADTNYILLEMPGSCVPKQMTEWIHELQVLGLVPVIAHPERNIEVMEDPRLLQQLVAEGAVAQLTTHSLLGAFGPKIRKTAWELCRMGKAHFVASDAHHPQKRSFRMREAYQSIRSELGDGVASCFSRNCAKMLKSERVDSIPESRKRFFSLPKFLRKL